MPDFSLEEQAGGIVCGLDEVGRGPLAGPVVAAAVVIPQDMRSLSFVSELRDSKKLSEKKRAELAEKIRDHCFWAIAEASPQQIDEMNILQASLWAMAQALERLPCSVDHALVDGNRLPRLSCTATPVVKGDDRSRSIAAASILAKVHRDTHMKQLAALCPHYGWERNMGYPTKEHREALLTHGITPYHRQSFAPVQAVSKVILAA